MTVTKEGSSYKGRELVVACLVNIGEGEGVEGEVGVGAALERF